MTVYQIISIILSVFGILGIATIPTFFIKERLRKKTNSSQHVQELLNKEQEDDLKSMIKKEVLPQISSVSAKVENIAKQLDKVCEGSKSSLRNDILHNFYSCSNKGYRNQEDTENFNDLYEAYRLLDGNSFIADTIYPAFMELEFKH